MDGENASSNETRHEDDEADALQLQPDPDERGVEPYEVFVQWRRGQSHEHAETINAPTDDMALMLAKRNVDLRQEPLSIWVVPRSEIARSSAADPSLVPSTDRSYRRVEWYAENQVDVEERVQRLEATADGSESPESQR